jgi:ketosteroid isomerase-like protein
MIEAPKPEKRRPMMNAGIDRTSAAAEVGAVMESWCRAVRAMDIDGIVAHYAADILAFDAVLQLQFKGVDAYREHWAACLTMCPGPTVFELPDLQVTAGDDVAFACGLLRCGPSAEQGEEPGEEKACWMRLTSCLRKAHGKWTIVHEHFSAPFDIETGKALFDLKP